MRFTPVFTVFAVGLAVGCGGPGDRVEITETQARSQYRIPPKPGVSNAERFQFAPSANSFAMASTQSSDSGEVTLHSATPPGWTELPATQFRQINMQFGPNGEGECYVSILPGGGGGMLTNANRWRGQMGLEPYTEEEFSVLPRYSILEQPAVYVDFEGDFTGMGAAATLENYRMTGLLLTLRGSGVFIKIVGPSELVKAEQSNFENFVGSLHDGAGHSHGPADDPHAGHDHGPGEGHGAEPVAAATETDTIGTLPEGHPPVDAPEAMVVAQAPGGESGGEARGNGFAWTAPEGWSKAPDRTMRLVTYTIDGVDDAECYVSLLGGPAGGLESNVNRWLGQFGGEPMSEDEINALPKVSILGKEVPLVETTGDFTSMRGEEKSDQALLGAAWISDDASVFIKMTGPEAAVKDQKEAFLAFCSSLKKE